MSTISSALRMSTRSSSFVSKSASLVRPTLTAISQQCAAFATLPPLTRIPKPKQKKFFRVRGAYYAEPEAKPKVAKPQYDHIPGFIQRIDAPLPEGKEYFYDLQAYPRAKSGKTISYQLRTNRNHIPAVIFDRHNPRGNTVMISLERSDVEHLIRTWQEPCAMTRVGAITVRHDDASTPSSESTQLSEESTQLSEESTQLSEESTQLSEEFTQLSEESTQLSEESTQLSEESTQLSIQLSETREPIPVMINEINRHPVTQEILNITFVTFAPTDRIKLSIPVGYINEAESLGYRRGALLLHLRHHIHVHWQGPHTQIPSRFTLNLMYIDLGMIIRATDLLSKLPHGMTLVKPVEEWLLINMQNLGGTGGKRWLEEEEAAAAAAAATPAAATPAKK